MKLLYFIAFLLIFVAGQAQNYAPFYKDRNAMYEDQNSEIQYIQVDSSYILNGDTIYVFFNHISNDGNCAKPTFTWLGKKVIKKQDHSVVFITIDDEHVLLKQEAAKGEMWIAYTYPDSSWLEYTVKDIVQDTIFSVMDSIKIFSLEFKTKFGQTSFHVLNGAELKISKHHGSISGYDFLHFTSPKGFNALTGIQNPDLGFYNLKAFEVWDFDVNEEIHILEEAVSVPNGVTRKTIKKYFGRTITNDSVLYQVSLTVFQDTYNFNKETHVYTLLTDTVEEKYPLMWNELDAYSYQPTFERTSLFLEPYRFNIAQTSDINSLPSKVFNSNPYFSANQDSCYSEGIWCCSTTNEYIKGLGGPYRSEFDDVQHHSSEKVVYYKKQNEEWGTPLTIEDGVNKKQESSILIFPNPVSKNQNVTFKLSNECELSIFSITGELISVQSLNSGSNDVKIDLAVGVYLLKIRDANGQYDAKRLSVIE